MSVVGGTENIITDELVFYVDAANPKSFINGNTTWDDMGGENNGTLINGPTFDSGDGGSIVFDGSNDYVDYGAPTWLGTGPITLSCFIKYGPGNITACSVISDYDSNGIGSLYMQIRFDNVKYFRGNNAGSSTNLLTTVDLNDDKWHNVVFTDDQSRFRIYIDGIEDNDRSSIPESSIANSTSFMIGQNGLGSSFFPGRLSNIKIYNRALSATEVAQNYNALKGRFGL
jgi:hypothetical protein